MSTKCLIIPTILMIAISPAAAAVKSNQHHHPHPARTASTRGDREVRALNELEAAGYRRFGNLHAQGGDFVATAAKDGRSYNVTVMPSGAINATIG